MAYGTFVTAINCMDGRVQEPVIAWMKAHFGVDFVDMITEPGADKGVAEADRETFESLRKKIDISVNTHGSRVVAIVGHYDCAGNPVSEEEHCAHVRKGVEVIGSCGLSVDVIGLWINEHWEVEQVY